MRPFFLPTLFIGLLSACSEGERTLPEAVAIPPMAEAPVGADPQSSSARAGLSIPDPRLDTLIVTLEPEEIRQGTLFKVLLETEGETSDLFVIEGSFAGEPLHFERGEGGRYWALSAAPVDATGEMELRVEATLEGEELPVLVQHLSITPGEYRLERLSVAPEFGDPYPPELARRISEESARAMAVSRASHQTPKLWSPPFVHPRDDRITSGFGHGRTFNGQVQSRHLGTDFAGAVGAPIVAPTRGVVALRDSFYLGGNVLYLDHGGGLVTAYLHLSEQTVAQGDTIEAGDLIGRVGATGRVTGPHLHWIVRYGEVSVDGQSLLGLR